MAKPSPRIPGYRGPISWPLLTQGQLEFITTCARRFGPVAGFSIGPIRYCVLSHPDHVEHVLKDRADRYCKRTHDYWLLRQLMGTSLLTGDGDFWKQRRRLIQPAFQRRQLEHLALHTVAATQEMWREWESRIATGDTFDVAPELTRLTLRIIGQTLFSTDLQVDASAVGRAVATVSRSAAWNWETFVSLVPLLNLRHRRALHTLHALIHRLVRERRQECEPRGDLLTALVAARDEVSGQPLTDQEIRNEVMTLILAGHDTTANLLTWCMHLLSTSPQVVGKWTEELDRVLGDRPPTLADIPQLTYTRQIVEEAMRLYPPIWAIPRKAVADDEIHGYCIRRGTYVLLATYVVQRDSAWWQDPEEFRPERFDRGLAASPRAGSYFPFGWGPRTCVGAQFATVETQLVLALLGQHFTWQPDRGHPVVPEGLITLHPRRGVRLRLVPRERSLEAKSSASLPVRPR